MILSNNTLAQFAKDFQFHVFPTMNPDGYEYSRSKNRLWRKNRRRNRHRSGQEACNGVDLNRNFPTGFALTKTSRDPCKEDYGVHRYINNNKKRTAKSGISQKKILKFFFTARVRDLFRSRRRRLWTNT